MLSAFCAAVSSLQVSKRGCYSVRVATISVVYSSAPHAAVTEYEDNVHEAASPYTVHTHSVSHSVSLALCQLHHVPVPHQLDDRGTHW